MTDAHRTGSSASDLERAVDRLYREKHEDFALNRHPDGLHRRIKVLEDRAASELTGYRAAVGAERLLREAEDDLRDAKAAYDILREAILAHERAIVFGSRDRRLTDRDLWRLISTRVTP